MLNEDYKEMLPCFVEDVNTELWIHKMVSWRNATAPKSAHDQNINRAPVIAPRAATRDFAPAPANSPLGKEGRMKARCEWCGLDPLYIAYHDDEWGVPVHDDRRLFEMLILEGAQAGLSWLTILKKRANYRKAFHEFDCERIATYTSRDKKRLLGDQGIVRNPLKIESTIKNARCALTIKDEFGSLASFLWRYVDGIPIQNKWKSMLDMAPQTARSDAMSKDLKRRGFNFVGSTICYAFMQAVGMVNDHTTACFRHREIMQLAQQDKFSVCGIQRR